MKKHTHLPLEPFTASELKAVATYDPMTGVFVSRLTGKEIGFFVKTKGYRCLKVLGKKCNEHRVAWLYVHGEWPPGEVDHINGVKTDNRIANLRCVDRAMNSQNQIRAHHRNKSGLLGVTFDKVRGAFQATIFTNGKKTFLGRFPTAELAHSRYLEEKRRVHAGCTI